MRHGDKSNHLGRKTAHRKSLMSNLATALIRHKRIATTLAKGRALRKFVEPLLTKSKNDTTHSRRVVFSYLRDKEVVTELFRDVAQKIATRPGGYTRILKTGTRPGDAAEMCLIELVDYNVNFKESGETKAKTEEPKKTRRSRGKKADTATDTLAEAAAPAKEAEAKPKKKIAPKKKNDE